MQEVAMDCHRKIGRKNGIKKGDITWCDSNKFAIESVPSPAVFTTSKVVGKFHLNLRKGEFENEL